MTAAKREKWYPLLLSGVLTVLIARITAVSGLVSNLLGAGITVSTVFIGFVGTMAGILMSMDSRAVRFMKRIHKFDVLLGYLWGAVQVSFAFLVLSLSLQAMQGKSINSVIASLIGDLWLFLGLMSLTATYRAIDVSMALIRNSKDE